ncbi:uncharacterized protein BO97DRAFT_257573 [Aspergillus homomorphus CBS 101889]|uniref:Concanavalin A-like lectin/glucanase n=1 Tax=Aspergillus homomorphus (strain CBS 101889) TaxID=1450537 RepID=A0A395I4B5_ASPHC|nr:hypothetical protein BO97DRAFT_257573 [Aspergillus homomorphus CBS 101889]RAL14817.1 hypothetical protein BO97DRAFT_257573 [Aspergillus homomorphus CBS 101889]
MPPNGSSFTALNLPSAFSLPQCMDYFTLTAGPNTDLWRKPGDRDTATAPIVFTSLRRRFEVAEVTVTADWEMEWDQGGLVIFAGAPPQSSEDVPVHHVPISPPLGTTPAVRLGASSPASSRPCKWVKAGMEFCSGTMNVSSVSATADGADWCASPLSFPEHGSAPVHSLRIKLERVGHALWIWYQVPAVAPYAMTPGAMFSGMWRKLREVTWFFYGIEDKFVHVGVYASRPNRLSRGATMWATMNGNGSDSTGVADGLVVEFEDLEIS